MNKLLERQIKKFLGDTGYSLDALEPLFQAISDAYDNCDEDRRLIERALDLSSGELTETNRRLRQEINDRKEAEEELRKAEEKYRILFEGALDAIFVADAETGILTDCNLAGTKLVGREKAELIGQSHTILHPPKEGNKEFNEVFKKHLKEETGKSLETQVITKTEEIREVAIKAKLLEIEGKKVLQGIFRDITEKKQAEKKLKSINEKLANSNQQLEEFIFSASHDLREPVRKVLAFGELLTHSLPAKFSGDEQENFNFMIEGSQRIWQLVETLLDYSKVITKEAIFTNVDLNTVIEQYRNSKMSSCIYETGGTLSIPNELPVVRCDPTQIFLLVHNILTNAFKYRKKDVPPVVTIRTFDLENGKVRVEVEDNGIGIKREQCERIFGIFRRMYSRREYEGTGIGLTLCKRIIEKHEGEIGVESKLGQGSIFWFTLPISKNQKDKLIESAVSCNA